MFFSHLCVTSRAGYITSQRAWHGVLRDGICIVTKSAIKREQSDARNSSAEREQTRPKVKEQNAQGMDKKKPPASSFRGACRRQSFRDKTF
ncbi:MAG: hypothetical protein IJ185_00435 [Prevotella sp.]|nr:hypothetical protein [Prevotella sp.]